MLRKALHLEEVTLRAELLPLLTGHVFHVTSATRCEQIMVSGAVSPNSDGSLGNTFPQSAASLARGRGYVCLFDLRHASDEEIVWGLDCFYFLAPRPLGEDICFLLLAPEHYGGLLQWKDIKTEVEIGAFHIPYVECWHSGPLPISKIGQILDVHVVPRPVDPHGLAFLLATANELPPQSPDGT